MPLYGPSTATATVGANTNSVTITGMDISNGVVAQGMTINFGSREWAEGRAYLINTVSPNGTSGGTLSLAGSVPSTLTNAPFLIDTRGFLGTDSSYAAAVSLKLLATLMNLLGTATNLFAGSRQIVLDKVASTALGRLAFATAGRMWGDLSHRTYTYTPTGGQAASFEALAVRAFPDGATPIDALLFDLATGAGDLRKSGVTMASATTTDLGSAPMGKVTITGSATINSFGAGKHLERLVVFADGGATLVHNAASLILPGGVNVAVQAGDCLHATSDASGNWRVRDYQRGDGTPLALPGVARRSGFRRRTVNGNFAINQRGVASASTTYPAGTYILDHWKAGAGGVTLSWAAVAGGDVTVTITAGSLMQVVEGGLYLPEGGTYTLSWAGTALASVNGGAYAASPMTVGGFFPGNNTVIEFGTGTVSLVQIEPGSVATTFERRDDEMTRCLRYYRVLANVPGQWFNTTGNTTMFTLVPVMRAAPTATLAKPQSGLTLIGQGPINISSINGGNFTPTGGFLNLTTAQASALGMSVLNDGAITLSAEL